MRSIKAAPDTVSIWVRADEEDPVTFLYRAVSATGAPPRCYRANASQDARASWTILGNAPLGLPACADLGGQVAPGTLYALQRAA